MAISHLANSLKGVSSTQLRQNLAATINTAATGGRFWSPSYIAGSCGGEPPSTIKDDITNQKRPDQAKFPPCQQGQGFHPRSPMTTANDAAAQQGQFRHHPPYVASERAMYQSWLDFHRGTLLWKCAALGADQLKTAPVSPSNLSLLGLVRHMAEVERAWFRIRAAGQGLDALYCSQQDPDAEFDNVAGADADADLATYKAECAAADEAVRAKSLDDTFSHRKNQISLRWVYVHMIEEYARHNGHADLLRERLDGVTGD